MTNITMTKEKKEKHYNDQREKGQTLQWPKRKIVMFVIFLFGHFNVCSFSLWSL
jgi:hypothetical protein